MTTLSETVSQPVTQSVVWCFSEKGLKHMLGSWKIRLQTNSNLPQLLVWIHRKVIVLELKFRTVLKASNAFCLTSLTFFVLLCRGFAISTNFGIQRQQYLATGRNSWTCLLLSLWNWDLGWKQYYYEIGSFCLLSSGTQGNGLFHTTLGFLRWHAIAQGRLL